MRTSGQGTASDVALPRWRVGSAGSGMCRAAIASWVVAASSVMSSAAAFGTEVVQFAVGRATPVQDGCVGRGEYTISIPYAYRLDGSMGTNPDDLPYSYRSPVCSFAWDDDCLYMAVESEGDRLKALSREHDGELWNDDSVDLFVSDDSVTSKTLFHFIFNSIGTVFDADFSGRAWRSHGVRVANGVKDGNWTLEVAVPWSNLGFTPSSARYVFRLNVGRTFLSSGGASAIRFMDAEDRSWASLGHGPFAKRETMARVFLRDKVGKVSFPELKPASPGESPRRQTVSVKDSAGRLLFWGRYPILPREPVVFRSVTSDPATQTMLFMTENNFTSGRYSIALDFKDYATDTTNVLRLSGNASPGRGLVGQTFDVSALPDGAYRLHFRITDEKGGLVGPEDYCFYGKSPPHPPWENCTAGAEDTVPPPWPAPTFRRDGFECWGRSVRLGGAGLVDSVVSQGREILAAPATVFVDGRPLAFAVTSFAAHVSYADYEFAALDSPLPVTVRLRAEFDGYMWFDVIRGAGEISSLRLELPVARSCVTGFDDGHSAIEKLPLPKGRRGLWTVNPVRNPFLWLGDGVAGLMAGTEDRRGWNLADPRRGYVLEVDDSVARVAFNFVDKPVSSAEPVTLGFYLNPTPVRPKNLALARFPLEKQCGWTGSVAHFFAEKIPGFINERKCAEFRARQHKGERVFYYGGSCIAAPYSPAWAWWGREWNFTGDPATVYIETTTPQVARKNGGGWVVACLRDKSFFDFKIWSESWFLNHPRYEVRDLYYDVSFPMRCRNAVHGCDNEYFLRAIREFHKRIYRQLKRKNPEGAMVGHVRFTRTPSDNFFDKAWMGEAYEREVAAQHNYYGLLSPEAMQIHYANRANDMVVSMLVQILRTYQVYHPEQLKDYDPQAPESRRAIRHAAAYFKLHDLEISVRRDAAGEIGPDWVTAEKCAEGLGDDVAFSSYYLPGCPVRDQSPERLFLYGVYHGAGGAVVILLNDTDEAKSKTLFVDAAKLGLAAKTGVDMFTGVPCALEGNTLSVAMGPREARFIRFAGSTGGGGM